MMYGMYSLWGTLYRQMPLAFNQTLADMRSYGAIGMLLTTTVGASYFTRHYIADQVRSGRLELDLMKPLNFIKHMLARSSGEFVVKVAIHGLLGFLFAVLILHIEVPATFGRSLAFLLSLLFGHLIFFSLNLMIGMLSIVTLDIYSYNWAFNALVTFASGYIVPLWLFPEKAAILLTYLPFQAIFFTPLSIYIGAEQNSLTYVLLVQLAWVLLLLFLTHCFWSYLHRRIVVQGG